ncbi:hypothetical protein [Streptomyces griseus]|uniref:hypothetical protein n=1 Tax=Streptomyces griseus TaxID=1911 RepID=UPI000849DB8B|nr:hypothetical protein [Streptomyces griseus]
MTAPSNRLDLPARRRRHARLIAALTTLIGECAEAAGAVYQPIAAASPGTEDVEVNVLPCIQVSLAAADLLDRARAEDDARWPAAMAWERAQAQRTYAARCAVAQAKESVEQGDLSGRNDAPLPSVEQAAAMDLVSAGSEVTLRWRTDPEDAVALVHELAAGGELAVDEILDDAVDAAALTGLLVLQGARTAPDPSTAAELCLSAISHIAIAVSLASADVD